MEHETNAGTKNRTSIKDEELGAIVGGSAQKPAERPVHITQLEWEGIMKKYNLTLTM